MKISLKQQYMAHPPGAVVDFPPPVCELLINRGIAVAVKQQDHYADKSVKRTPKVKAKA